MQNSDLIRLNDICFWNKETDSLHVDDKDIKLSISQKRALKLLIENLGKPVLNADIFYEVHDSLDKEFNEKSVRNLISGLRKLVLELNIVNIYGGIICLKTKISVKILNLKSSFLI